MHFFAALLCTNCNLACLVFMQRANSLFSFDYVMNFEAHMLMVVNLRDRFLFGFTR